ncbi:TetR/AcrR family transcriptional regulator [Actinomadura luteofluorescens]|uniref:AcrR family transcriptional regulator n=1 Tax=Actinomadura luteofluorescens TaxID=46163 RepID=A0A7Y9JMN1_9ACTN|nr:TetR family transcriptional regulator [Actinomadura luteofluorescens]NYD52764.1 AcrR family transcriptional regulator [Actinomadura luteofluorescens]
MARETRVERRQRTREELVASATRLFAEQGVAATSVEAIAESAGYSRGAYHSNFETREEILDAVVARVVGSLGPELVAVLRGQGGVLERLAAYVRGFLQYCARRPVETRALVAVISHRAAAADVYDELVAASLADVVALLEEGQRTGELRRFDLVMMASMLRRTLDAEGLRVARGAPVDAVGDELIATFVRATRSAP